MKTMSTEHILGTLQHKKEVGEYMGKFASDLFQRAVIHDYSKFSAEELELFETVTPLLRGLVYGSQKQKDTIALIKPAIDHHYEVNSHHPEHYPEGVNDMTLMDVVEMLCDWMAAVKRHETGNIMESLEINKKRFGIDDQLQRILKNTVEALK